jgi:hypothetical protein
MKYPVWISPRKTNERIQLGMGLLFIFARTVSSTKLENIEVWRHHVGSIPPKKRKRKKLNLYRS